MNIVVLLWTWSAVAWVSSPHFADTHYLVTRSAGLVTHLAIYLAILVGVRKLVSPRTPKADSLTTLATSASYSGVVTGFMAYLVTVGAVP